MIVGREWQVVNRAEPGPAASGLTPGPLSADAERGNGASLLAHPSAIHSRTETARGKHMAQGLRSRLITEGVQRTPNRAMLRAVGFGDADFEKPIVAIANAHSTLTPCNARLDELARAAEAAVRKAGAMPQLFGTITVSDGISMGTEVMKFSLVSREVIADSIETVCNAQCVDGVLAVGGCDKNMPGALIAIARMNIPAVFVYGGTIKPGHYKGQDLTVVSAFEAVGQY